MIKKAKKSLSQNYLIDKNICKKIIKQTIIKNEQIIEIGPGYGALTDEIIKKKPKKILLIEKDNQLSKYLKKKYENFNNISIINSDVLKINLSSYLNSIIISNLPYNVSTKIILNIFESSYNFNELVCMVQKEVANKFDYKIGKINKYKFLTRICCDYKKCFDISPNVFYPKPKVFSSVIKFKFNNKNINWIKANSFVKKIFKNKRKKIIKNINIKNYNMNEIKDKRIEELSIDQLLDIYDFF